jgi:hypothetical protein
MAGHRASHYRYPATTHMRLILLIAICAMSTGCERPQPESIKTAAAYSVPLRSDQDRNELLSILRAVAKGEGAHLDASNQQQLESMAPNIVMTIHAAVWRGSTDDELVASIMDDGHLSQAWIMFSRGTNPKAASRFREHAMREIVRRWPDTLSLPIMPNGSIPLYSDLIQTPGGYVVAPSAASKYALKTAISGR